MTEGVPTAFVSYSWDSDEHKRWVHDLATRMRSDGIDVTLDQWHAVPGDQLPQFMETAIRENDYVLIVCTPKYSDRSDSRTGGVGYEGDIITAEIASTRNHRKFIPVLRGADWDSSAPSWIKGKYYLSLQTDPYTESSYSDLLATIHQTRPTAPPIGRPPSPATPRPHLPIPASPDEPIKITGILVGEVSEPRMDGTRGSALYAVPFRLSRSPSRIWSEAFLQTWLHPPRCSTMHRPNIAHVLEDRIILDGTTIDEVRDYHRDTLVLCVEHANAMVTEYEQQLERKRQAELAKKQAHKQSVRDISRDINFD